MKKNNDYWLVDLVDPILRAMKVDDHFLVANLIQSITENLLYDLWVEWKDEDRVKWTSKSNKSFALWLSKKSNETKDRR